MSLAVLQAVFFAITVFQKPSSDTFAAYYFAWVMIPAAVAAVSFAPRFHFVAAISNGLFASLLFDYLFLQHGYFWPERPIKSPRLAVTNVLVAIALAFVVAGFVHSIIDRLKQSRITEKQQQTLLAIRIGLQISIIIIVIIFLFCAMPAAVGPGVESSPRYLFAAGVASCFAAFVTLIAFAVGTTFDSKEKQKTCD